MGSKVIRNITKVFKSASGVLFGRATAGTGRGEELTPSQVRSLLSVYTISQTDTAISTAVNALVAGAPGLLDTLDELSAALGDDANFASTVTTALAGKVDSSSLNESIDDRVAALLVAGTNISLTYNDASGTLTIASTAGGLSGTGSVDNAALRADGTGGATLQSSAWIINDNLTASPNNTVNHACLEANGGTTNVSVSIKPKGTGAFCLSAPDGTVTGGNVRGANSVDLQTLRSAANQVASGDGSFLAGRRSRASGVSSFCFGDDSSAGGQFAVSIGCFCQAPAYGSMAIGINALASNSQSVAISNGGVGCTASGADAFAMGDGSLADRTDLFAYANGRFATNGDAQEIGIVLRNKTTNTTPVNLYSNGASARLTIPSGKTVSGFLVVKGIKSDGTTGARFVRLCDITNVGGTTAMDVAAETIGTDWNPQGCTLAVTGENATDDLQVNVTGPDAQTWRWVANFIGLEIAYGT